MTTSTPLDVISMKLCIFCRHASSPSGEIKLDGATALCASPNSIRNQQDQTYFLVDGKHRWARCYDMRNPGANCGTEGKWFERKSPEQFRRSDPKQYDERKL